LGFPRQNLSSEIRLNRYLARCGVGSRRYCDDVIRAGRVTVNGETVGELGVRVRPGRDVVEVDGRRVAAERFVYYLLNKPRDVISTSKDPRGRRTVMDFLPPGAARMFVVGRLDRESEGLVLLTNDGGLANRLLHPRYHIARVYQVWTDRPLKQAEVARLRKGVQAGGEMMKAAGISRMAKEYKGQCYEFVLKEGRNRQIRRMLGVLGVKVVRLKRVQFGPLKLGRLALGRVRELDEGEVGALQEALSAGEGGRCP